MQKITNIPTASATRKKALEVQTTSDAATKLHNENITVVMECIETAAECGHTEMVCYDDNGDFDLAPHLTAEVIAILEANGYSYIVDEDGGVNKICW